MLSHFLCFLYFHFLLVPIWAIWLKVFDVDDDDYDYDAA